MSMQISIDNNPNMTIYYHGTMTMPHLKYDSDYRWTCTLIYMAGKDSYTVNEVEWDRCPNYDFKDKAEKRIADLCLKLWNKKEKETHKDIIQYHDPGDEQEREYTVADLDADGDIPEPTTADEFNMVIDDIGQVYDPTDLNIKRYKENRVKLSRRHSTRRKQP